MKTYHYLIEIQYLGFRYHGWQKQPGLKTVQGMLEKTFTFIFGHSEFKTLGAGRTDAMVSTNKTAFELFLRQPVDTTHLVRDLNFNLPPDINILSVKEVDEKFNILQNAKEKEYLYLFAFGKRNHPFAAPFMAYVREELDIGLMEKGARLFLGTHDFRRYAYKPGKGRVFQREIKTSEIVKNDLFSANFFPQDSYLYRVSGSGFMRYQVRIMAAALIKLGKGELTLEEIKDSLKGEDSGLMCPMAPPSGLILNSVDFDFGKKA
ncbi:MAG: tRNA pseudouridine(38-40) synthase TruA [Cyclobacteriaceae bacterium]